MGLALFERMMIARSIEVASRRALGHLPIVSVRTSNLGQASLSLMSQALTCLTDCQYLQPTESISRSTAIYEFWSLQANLFSSRVNLRLIDNSAQ